MEKNSSFGIIYKATNIANGKIYIGQTVRSLNVRIRRHIYDAKIENKTIFHKALNKYGKDNFKWDVIDTAYCQEDLDNKEIYWINHYNSYFKNKDSNGCNMTIGGYGASGENHPSFNVDVPVEVRDKISNTLKGKFTGVDSVLSKPVIQLSLDGKFIRRYESMSEAVSKVGNHIGSACRGKIKSAHGFIWIYEEEFNEKNVRDKVSSYLEGRKANNRVRIVQLDLNMNLIKIHNSAREAIESVANHSNSGNILKCCCNKASKAYGYKWMYEEDYNNKGDV